jgi:hypothetical protein
VFLFRITRVQKNFFWLEINALALALDAHTGGTSLEQGLAVVLQFLWHNVINALTDMYFELTI